MLNSAEQNVFVSYASQIIFVLNIYSIQIWKIHKFSYVPKIFVKKFESLQLEVSSFFAYVWKRNNVEN